MKSRALKDPARPILPPNDGFTLKINEI
uniref:Uncharacterized protein n=1 Tax=Tetranychus urticae TaxID=32264 RepID=T1KDT3_TETUR